jgi:hypothetical protein
MANAFGLAYAIPNRHIKDFDNCHRPRYRVVGWKPSDGCCVSEVMDRKTTSFTLGVDHPRPREMYGGNGLAKPLRHRLGNDLMMYITVLVQWL